MIRFNEILDRIVDYQPSANLDIIRKAYVFSAQVHREQVRLSGEPYLSHPLETAYILTELRMDDACVAAGLLHDVLEDSLTTNEDLAKEFGDEVTQLVDGVTKIGKIHFTSKLERKAENYRKMLIAMAKDIRVIIIKLADRLHNMRTLDFHTPQKQESISLETLEIYAPIANRLGMSRIKGELEDLAFKYIKPVAYKELKAEVEKRMVEREKYVAKVRKFLKELLEKHNISGDVSGRPKHLYSVSQKMDRQKVGLEQIYDLIAFRIIVKDVRECYEALGLVHSQWKPIPGRFKDYIAAPKPNLYQSLHTTVIGPEGGRIEIQIRTDEMHRIAEYGVAAHWKYKEKKGQGVREEEKYAWLRQLMEWQQETKDAKDFMDSIKTELFTEEVYIFTPKGDVKVLPKGSTPVDFAYAIHSDVGNHCVGAKVNGRIVPLRHELATGDIVDVLTSPQQKPSSDWLKFVKTAKAKTKIRQVAKERQHERSIEIGKELIEKTFKKHELNFAKLTRKEMNDLNAKFNVKTDEDLFSEIGYGKISPIQVLHELLPEEKKKEFKLAEPDVKKEGAKDGIVIKELDGVLIRFARCCTPLPGDPVIGFISRGKGITVHSVDCPNMLNADPRRIISASWDPSKHIVRPIKIRVECVDEPGLLSNISTTISALNVNISEAKIVTTPDKRAVCDFEILVQNATHLSKIAAAVGKVKGVYSVARRK